jgi:hypothetical protein
MDPNENLKAQARAEGPELLALRLQLEHWLCTGGFTPDWSRYPQTSSDFMSWHTRRLTAVLS